MDFRISTHYQSLIKNLLSLKLQPYSKQETAFLNQCIEHIERIAIIRSYLNGLYNLPKKEIKRLNNIEAKFLKKIYPLITYSKISNTYEQLDSLPRFFVAISCVSTLVIIALITSVLLTSLLTPLASLLLVFALATSLIILQSNLSSLSKSPTLSYLEDKISALIRTLKKVTTELDRDISLLESKLSYRESINPKFTPPYENLYFPTAPSELSQTPHSPTFFSKSNPYDNNNISTINYLKDNKYYIK
ncbi:MAG: hypothetical protein V4471_07130 [Pseudomonadota bacterium]